MAVPRLILLTALVAVGAFALSAGSASAIAQPNLPDVKAPVTVDATIDLREVQVALQNSLNGIRKVDRCGENYNVWDARVLPNRTSVKVDFHARFFLNKCVITTVPEWRGIWHMEWHDRVVAETILISQAGHIAVDLTPVIQNGEVTFDANVVTADMNGLLGRLKLNGQIKAFLNDKIRDAIREHLKVALPPEMHKADVKITELTFFDEGGGELGAHIKATGILAPSL